MKLRLLVLITLLSTGIAGKPESQPDQVPLPEIQIRHRELKDGEQVIALWETLYRSQDRILDTIKYRVARGAYGVGGVCRVFRVGGQLMLLEEDYRGDGNVTVRVFGKQAEPENFEVFKRQANGSVEPVSSTELAKLRRESQEIAGSWEGFTRWVSERLESVETDSRMQIMRDIETVGDAVKKAQEAMAEQKVQQKK